MYSQCVILAPVTPYNNCASNPSRICTSNVSHMHTDSETVEVTRTEATKAQYRAIYARLLKLTEDEIRRYDLLRQQDVDECVLIDPAPVLATTPDDPELGAVVPVERADPTRFRQRTHTPKPGPARRPASVPRRQRINVPRRGCAIGPANRAPSRFDLPRQ